MTDGAASRATAGRPSLQVLVVDDDRAFRIATRTLLEDEGYGVKLAAGVDEALGVLEQESCDLLLSDLVMERSGGMELLKTVKSRWPDLPVIMVTGFASIATAVEAMRLGAADYLTKPINNAEMVIKVQRAAESRLRDRELATLRAELQQTYSFANFTTRSPRMRAVITQIQQVANTDLTVLIQGESGTGKELVARAIHTASGRRGGPFVAVNCSALPENLFESELFGHEKGAFTGATQMRKGKFEESQGGTIFLDEIGDIPPGTQAKLLRVLQEKTVERIGSNKSLSIDARVLAATNRNLEVMVAQGDFREDLFYRLNVFPITLPPLRERLEDIPLLVDQFLARHADLTAGRAPQVSPAALAQMMTHAWRGNIRELENLIRRALVQTQGSTIESLDLPGQAPPSGDTAAHEPEKTDTMQYKDYIATVLRTAEEQYLIRILKLCNGNINQISRLMNLDRKTIYRKLSEYSIDPAPYRQS